MRENIYSYFRQQGYRDPLAACRRGWVKDEVKMISLEYKITASEVSMNASSCFQPLILLMEIFDLKWGLCPEAAQTFISIRVRGRNPWSEGWQTRVWAYSINLFTCSTPVIGQHHSPNIRPCLMVWPARFVFTLYPFSPNSFFEPVLGSYLGSVNHLCLFSWMKENVNML